MPHQMSNVDDPLWAGHAPFNAPPPEGSNRCPLKDVSVFGGMIRGPFTYYGSEGFWEKMTLEIDEGGGCLELDDVIIYFYI